jgi:hypothetical protein
MPFQQVEGSSNPLATTLGLVGGYLAANPARKAAQAKQEYERSEKSKEDARADQQLALNAQAGSRDQQTFDAAQAHERLREGAMANLSKQIPQPTSDPIKDPGAWQQYYARLAVGLYQAGFGDDAAKAQGAGATIGRAMQSVTQGDVNVATVPLRGAQTVQAKATAKDIGTRHQDRVMSDQDRIQIARDAAQASLVRAQIAASAADRRAAEATARAQMAIAAALARQANGENAEDRRQQRGFAHQDASQSRAFKHQDAKAKAANIPAQNAGSLETNVKFKALPGSVQSVILSEIKKGASIDGVRQDLQSSQLDDKIKAAALEALGAPAAAPAPAAPNPIMQWFQSLGKNQASPNQAGP